jgi:hypothetical protein
MIEKAIELAVKAHKGQPDKSVPPKPYIYHPLSVMLAMEKDGFIDDVLCVAVLHDVVEDTDVTMQDIIDMGFSIDVILGMDAMTRRDDETYKQYIERCISIPIGSAVKYYDSGHNISRRDGIVDENFIKFLEKRYGGTLSKINAMLEENPDLWKGLKR